jgi:predicted nucleic acid-binding protein
MKLYLDTCIWLNIFNKNEQEKEFLESKKLISLILFNKKFKIYYSGLILKEIKYKLNTNDFIKKRNFFRNEKTIFLKTTNKDYESARNFELNKKNKLSFFDYLHLSVCKNNQLILITRDKELLKLAKTEIIALNPKELFQRINFF